MNIIKKSFILFLSLSFLFLQFPNAVFGEFYSIAKLSSKITKKAPQILKTPEVDLPIVKKAATQKKGSSKLLWYILGLGVVGGAAAGGGGGGSSNSSDTGTIVISGPAP